MPLNIPVLILPGLGNSGPEHWQSYWEREEPLFERVLQRNWETPHCQDWVARLNEVLEARSGLFIARLAAGPVNFFR
jgi:predicted alpha/beta hydrolase family esterase